MRFDLQMSKYEQSNSKVQSIAVVAVVVAEVVVAEVVVAEVVVAEQKEVPALRQESLVFRQAIVVLVCKKCG